MVAQDQRPDLVKRAGVVAPHRIRQVHLDYVFMGLILIAVGLAIPSLSNWIAIPLVFGTLVNPALFVPQAFSRRSRTASGTARSRSSRSSASPAASWPPRSPGPAEPGYLRFDGLACLPSSQFLANGSACRRGSGRGSRARS